MGLTEAYVEACFTNDAYTEAYPDHIWDNREKFS